MSNLGTPHHPRALSWARAPRSRRVAATARRSIESGDPATAKMPGASRTRSPERTACATPCRPTPCRRRSPRSRTPCAEAATSVGSRLVRSCAIGPVEPQGGRAARGLGPRSSPTTSRRRSSWRVARRPRCCWVRWCRSGAVGSHPVRTGCGGAGQGRSDGTRFAVGAVVPVRGGRIAPGSEWGRWRRLRTQNRRLAWCPGDDSWVSSTMCSRWSPVTSGRTTSSAPVPTPRSPTVRCRRPSGYRTPWSSCAARPRHRSSRSCRTSAMSVSNCSATHRHCV